MKNAFSHLDSNGDSQLSFDEIKGAVAQGAKAAYGYDLTDKDVKTLKVIYDMVDADNSGSVDSGEWADAIDEVFEDLDADDSGTVNFCELAEAFQKFQEELDK